MKDVKKGPNGEEMLSSVFKLKKKSELDTYVKRANAFGEMLKEKSKTKAVNSADLKGI